MLRHFTDLAGREWRVWDVMPTSQSSLVLQRQVPTASAGWLAFETRAERRRLSPIPTEWTNADDAGLMELLEKAQVVKRITR